eukprot:scaffold29645_cov16-Prasinocladus_malaysianus.AAC.2
MIAMVSLLDYVRASKMLKSGLGVLVDVCCWAMQKLNDQWLAYVIDIPTGVTVAWRGCVEKANDIMLPLLLPPQIHVISPKHCQ